MIGTKIRQIRKSKDITVETLAKVISVSQPQMSRLEKGVNNFSLDQIKKIADALEVPALELLSAEFDFTIAPENGLVAYKAGVAPMIQNLTEEEIASQHYIAIPLLDMSAAAGGGYEISEFAEFIKPLIFEIPYLRKLGNCEESFGMFAYGDSMEPVLPNGSMIIVDKTQYNVWPGKIYLVRVRTALYVKYIDVLMDKIVLRSENPKYIPIEIPTNEIDEPDFQILGRVIWHACED